MNITGNATIRNHDYFVSVEDERTGDREVVVGRTFNSLRNKVQKLSETDPRFDGVQVYRQYGTGPDAFAGKCSQL